MKRNVAMAGCFLGLATVVALGQQPPASQSPANRLVTGKILYVGQMPGGLDQWIIQDLRAWGRYQVSPNSEGVDLTLRAYTPPRAQRPPQLEQMPMPHRAEKPPQASSLTIQDWVTGEVLWRARIVMRKQKKNENVPPGPHTEIFARGMKPDQVAERCVTLLKQYVDGLEREAVPKGR